MSSRKVNDTLKLWEKQDLLNQLKKVYDKCCLRGLEHYGICTLVQERYNDYLREIFAKWPEFSGNPQYPVKAPDLFKEHIFGSALAADQSDREKTAARMIYRIYSDLKLNKWSEEYGASRLLLLSFLIRSVITDIARHEKGATS